MPDNAFLQAEGVSLAYGRDARVVEGLNLAIGKGRFTALLGPNGSGKSTVLRAFAGLHALERGEIVLEGHSIARMGSKKLAREIAILAQSATTPDGMTVEDVVRQGRYPHRSIFGPWRARDAEAVETSLQRTGLADLRHVSIDKLSGGQRQRVWIAMTLAQESRVLLLDEPTTFLDLGHQVEVLGLMRRLVDQGDVTVVAVLHDLFQAGRYADEIVLMKDGRILCHGLPGDVLTRGHLARAYGVDVTVIPDPETGAPICLPRRAAPE